MQSSALASLVVVLLEPKTSQDLPLASQEADLQYPGQAAGFSLINTTNNWINVMFTERVRLFFSGLGNGVNRVQWVVKGTQRQAANVNQLLCLSVYAVIL